MIHVPEIFVISGIHYASTKPVRIEIKDGLIHKVKETSSSDIGNTGLFIAPGLIDNQVNGYEGVNFADELLTVQRLQKSAEAIWRDGVTSFMPTLVTDSHDNLVRNFRILAEAASDEFFMNCIPGFHLEGPYLSPEPGFYGCHPPQYLRKPSWTEFTEFQEAAKGKIIDVTVAPELEGAIEFIRSCVQSGVVVSIGHTNANAEQINLAAESGARISTHLGNGCANLIDRHKNPLWPQLANDLLTPTIIGDGHHLLPEEIRVFYKVKGAENIMLTSDVTHFIGMPPGEYNYMGSRIVKTIEGIIRIPELNCLAGASFPIKTGVDNVMDYTGCTQGVAIKLASENVARSYNLTDRGTLEAGKRADLILFEKRNNKIIIKSTWVKGKCVYQA